MIKFAPKITHKGFAPLFKDGVYFIKIPKIATTTAKLVLKDWENTHPMDMIDETKEVLALVRHPVDRWLSGMAQYMSGRQRRKISADQGVEQMIFDVHTTPQAWWLEGLTPTLFKLENIQKLWAHLGIKTRRHEHHRQRPTIALSDEHRNLIEAFYVDDLALYRSAQ